MKTYLNLGVIGTSHISSNSVKEIQKEYAHFNPDIIAVELDSHRLHILLHPEQKASSFDFRIISQIGFSGFLFGIIGHFAEKKLGSIVGTKPGDDMLAAVTLAQSNKKQLALIDRDIRLTLRQFSKSFTWREKFRIVGDIFFSSRLVKKIKGIKGFDLNSVPSEKVLLVLLDHVKLRYPSLYDVLVEQRNQIMAKKLMVLMKKNPEKKILAVVGAGHVPGMMELIEKRLSQIEVV